MIGAVGSAARALREWVEPNVREFSSSRQLTIWMLAVVIGAATCVAAIAFREVIGLVQWLWLGTRAEAMLEEARDTPWPVIMLVPVLGGLVVGAGLWFLTSNRRTGGVPDVIEARALAGRDLPLRDGAVSASLAAVSLGAGASAGREGPLVHLGATLADNIVRRFDLPANARRTLLGCGVASAVSASFNAPIAGVLFAHEVVLGHYAGRAFVPIVIASTLAAIGSRLWFGEGSAFVIPEFEIASYLEFPAFALLGVVAALVAVAFQFVLFAGDVAARRSRVPVWLLPATGGALVGVFAVFYPEILGVGYATVDDALRGLVALDVLLVLIPLKAVATAITLGCRFGGGIFSPSLFLGASTGAAFGAVVTALAPGYTSAVGLYALLGMGAVSGAVLGAPISTALIVFELTGGYALSIALLLSVAIAHGINQAIHDHSYFQWQLEARGLFLQSGPHRAIGRSVKVMDFMRLADPNGPPPEPPAEDAPVLRSSDTLEAALRVFDTSGELVLPVVDERDATKVVGRASQVRALERFNSSLIAASVEEHR